MAGLFQKLEFEAFRKGITPRSKESRAWFMNKAKNLNVSRSKLMKEDPIELRSRPAVGKMYMYFYDPKTKDTLPYYDRFPLILLVDINKGGMTGLNLHYLPIRLRQKLFYSLLNRVNSRDMNEDTYIRMTYDFLKDNRAVKEYRPCFKKYLTQNIKGNIAQIPASEWEVAVHLPLASFEKKDERTVHRESERIIERF